MQKVTEQQGKLRDGIEKLNYLGTKLSVCMTGES